MSSSKSLELKSRIIREFTGEELVKERAARAAREEIFRRICNEADATGCTFGEAADHLGISQQIVDYFQAERERAKGVWTKILAGGSDQALPRGENRGGPTRGRFRTLLKNKIPALLALSTILVIVGLGGLLGIFFRYEVRTTDSVGVVIRMDRFTGTVEWCRPNRGCSDHISR